MVSQHAMATTVRKVKQENRLRRQNHNQDEEGPYKAIPPPKPVPNNQKKQNGQQFWDDRQQPVATSVHPQVPTSGTESRDSINVKTEIRNSGQIPFAPEYRMPPLYGEEQSSSQAQQAANLQTHSSKFPSSRKATVRSPTIVYAILVRMIELKHGQWTTSENVQIAVHCIYVSGVLVSWEDSQILRTTLVQNGKRIEREVVLSSGDKNSKIPILHEYKQRTAGRVAIAPDAPIKQQAWVQE
ncbi:hypothetical protein M0804_014170, partial [Polistes exclamans]